MAMPQRRILQTPEQATHWTGPWRALQDRPLWVAAMLVVLTVAVFWPYRHFAGDDAYITFRFARNIADGLGFSYNPGTPTYGSTAPLWVFLIAGVSLLGLSIPDAAHLLNWIFVLAAVPIFYKLALRYLDRGAAACAAVLLVLDPWFIHWGISGMENGLALCLLMGVLWAQSALRNSGRVNWVTPWLAGLAVLCRPEMTLLAGMVLLDILVFERRRRWANLLAALAGYTLVVGPWLVYALQVFAFPIPNTIAAKLSSDHLAALERVVLYFGTFWVFQGLAAAAIVAYAPLRRELLRRLPAAAPQWLLPVAWALVLPVFYIAGGAPVAGRYMMFGLPCYLLIGVGAWSLLWRKTPRLIAASMLATLALVLFVQFRYCWYLTHFPEGMDPRMIEAARSIRELSKASDLVAADQIGVLGYFTGRPILDVFGLASPEVLPYRRQQDQDPAAVWRYVHKRGVQYLFVINTLDELRRLDAAYRTLSLVKVVPVWREGASAAAAPTIYYVYRTNW